VVSFTVDTSQSGFAGYANIEPTLADGGIYVPLAGDAGPNLSNYYIRSRVYYGSPIIATDNYDDRQLITYNMFDTLLSIYNLGGQDPARGFVVVSTVDCNDDSAPGFSASIDEMDGATQFYVANGVPITTATETDLSGIVGWANVPTGARTIMTRFTSSQRPAGSFTFIVEGGWLTYADVGPSYTQ
jgi:hypothetical protein